MSLMPQFGFFELITVAVIALVVVGPKDLPRMMRSAGKMVRQARSLAAEFMGAFDQMSRELEMEEMRKEIEALKKDNVFAETKRSLDEAVKPVDKALRDEDREVRAAMRDASANAPAGDDASPPREDAAERAPAEERAS